MAFKSNPEIDIDVRRIYDVLDAANVGDVVTHDQLTAVIGRDVRNGARAIVQRARKRQLDDRARVWLSVRKIGYKLAGDEDADPMIEHGRLGFYRMAKREGRKLSTIEIANLDREAKTRVLAAQSMLGVIGSVTKPAALERIGKRIREANDNEALPLAKTLEAFSK